MCDADNTPWSSAIGEKASRLYAQAGTLLALDRPILSRPLTTILDLPNTSLEAWISQAEPTILRCISDANDEHVQANPIDDYFPRLRDG
jgi:ABC-type protease/lipase transport system fused ATPase/permease subunit